MRTRSRIKHKKASADFTDVARSSAAAAAASAEEEFKDLRAKLLKRGYSLRSFALTHGYKVQTVYYAAKRTRHGKKSASIFEHLSSFLNLERREANES